MNCFLAVSVGNEELTNVPTVEAKAFDYLGVEAKALAGFNSNNTVFADFFNNTGDKFTNF